MLLRLSQALRVTQHTCKLHAHMQTVTLLVPCGSYGRQNKTVLLIQEVVPS
jgi:hypothetical protein